MPLRRSNHLPRPLLPLAPPVGLVVAIVACGGNAIIDGPPSEETTPPSSGVGAGPGSSGTAGSTSTSTSTTSSGTPKPGDKPLPEDDPDDPCDVTHLPGCPDPPETAVSVATSGVPLHVVGIYANNDDGGFQCHPAGTFALEIQQPGHHVLALSAYEPTHWAVTAGPDTVIDTIIIDGYHEAYWTVPDGVKVEEHTYEGTSSYIVGGVYEYPSTDATTLIGHVEQATGSQFASFHGGYCMSSLTL